MKIFDALDLFLLDCQSRRLTKATLSFYRDKAGRFMRWLAGENDVTQLESITATHIKRYLVSLQARGLTEHSQHDYARVVRTFLNYCVRDELLEKSPFSKVKMPRVNEGLPVVLTNSEIRTTLQKVTNQRNRLIVRFILDSGVRASELLALNVGDVDMATGVVTVNLGKGRKSRLTSIGGITRKELKRYLINRTVAEVKAPLIVGLRGNKRLSLIGLMSVFRTMKEESSIEHLTAHTLRRTMATKSLENGIDAYVLAKLLGHADLQMLRKYAAVNKEFIQEQAEKFSVVDNLD